MGKKSVGQIDDDDPYVIHGRPDFANPEFGITRAKKHAPYVFSIRGLSCLVHKVAYVEIRWFNYGPGGHTLIRTDTPKMIANTVCGYHFFLEAKRSRTCQIPDPAAVLCGRCHGEVATFGKDGPAQQAGISKQAAHIALGCAVKGY